MTPQEKANELCKKYVEFKIDGQHRIFGIELSKQCALIAVDEILQEYWSHNTERRDWWKQVKKEIEKL